MNRRSYKSALPIALITTTLALTAGVSQAEITQDCILEGTVDMRRAEQLGQPFFVKFRRARSGGEASCAMNQRARNRRTQLITAPNLQDLYHADLSQGDRVRYRYIERDGQRGFWELVDIDS